MTDTRAKQPDYAYPTPNFCMSLPFPWLHRVTHLGEHSNPSYWILELQINCQSIFDSLYLL